MYMLYNITSKMIIQDYKFKNVLGFYVYLIYVVKEKVLKIWLFVLEMSAVSKLSIDSL